MSIRHETRFIVVCDECGKEHHREGTSGAMAARVAAGVNDGWIFHDRGISTKSRMQKHYDFCSRTCHEAKAVAIPQIRPADEVATPDCPGVSS